jgi:diacylglycerol kinase family enzyme
MGRHRRIRSWTALDGLCVRSVDGRPLPVQVDGDYIGEVQEARYAVSPQALTVVS